MAKSNWGSKAPAAMGMATMLYATAQAKFWWTFSIVAFDRDSASITWARNYSSPLMPTEYLRKMNRAGQELTWESLLPNKTTEAASEAAFSLEWVCIAIPTSAAAKDGVSFIPSPTWTAASNKSVLLGIHLEVPIQSQMTGFLCCPQHLIDEELKHVTIATLCPSPCKVDITPAFSCGVSEDCVFSFLIPTVLPMLATASSLSPDSRSVVMPSSCNLILTKENKVFLF
jgi:hypothetical protein